MNAKYEKRMVIIIFFVLGFLLCWGSQKVWKRYKVYRDEHKIIKEQEKIHLDLSQRDSITSDNSGRWTKENFLIAHAGGGIDGGVYTNSKEAFECAVKNGFRVIETDFLVTHDNKVVLCHSWEDAINDEKQEYKDGVMYKGYMETKVQYRFSAMDIDGLISFMKENTNVFIVTDMKFTDEEKEERINKVYSEIYRAANGDEEILNRFIVQVYDEESCEIISSIYNFPEKIYTLYRYGGYNYEAAALLCLKYDIPVLTSPQRSELDEEAIEMLHSKGIRVYVHTVNNLVVAEKWMDKGIDGIYTDWILPNDLKQIRR